MKHLKHLLSQQWFSYVLATCSAVVLYLLLSKTQGAMEMISSALQFISPVVIGAAFAYLMNPIGRFFEKKLEKIIVKENLRHTVSVVLAVVCTLLAIVLIIVAVVPSVVSNFVTLGSNMDAYISMVDKFFDKTQADNLPFSLEDLSNALEQPVKNLLSMLPGSLGKILKTSVSVGSTLANVGISFVIAIYFLMDKKRIKAAIDRLRKAALSSAVYRRNTDFWKHCDHVFMQYISCNLMDALIIGAANAVFMLMLNMPYVSLISVLVAVTNLVPTFGPIVGGVIGAFRLVINKPILAVWFILFTIVLQTLDAYVIKPRLFGASLGIPSFLTLISIILGGKLYGILGIFLAIPVVSILLDLYNDSLLPWLEGKRKKAEEEDLQETADP